MYPLYAAAAFLLLATWMRLTWEYAKTPASAMPVPAIEIWLNNQQPPDGTEY
jgi:hypothetical protein